MRDIREEVLDGLLALNLQVGATQLIIEIMDGPVRNLDDSELPENGLVNAYSRIMQSRSVDHIIQFLANEVLRDLTNAKQQGLNIEKYGLFLNQIPVPHNSNMIRFGKIVKIPNLSEIRKAHEQFNTN